MKGLLFLCALAVSQPRRPACPDGTPPRLTGHPLRPAACDTAKERAPQPAELPQGPLSDDDLAGVWRGWAYHSGERFAVEAELFPRERRLRWSAKSANTHAVHELLAEARPRFLSRKQPWKLKLRSPSLTQESLSGRLWTGGRTAVWAFDGAAQEHRLDYSLEGPGTLKVRYRAATAGAEPYVLELTLSR